MKRKLTCAALAAALIASPAALAQGGPGTKDSGMGPGMGPGMMGPGYGQGYGPGYGAGYGPMGPGMMGQGMMGGYGMGPGMMGPGMMGPGMMGGYGMGPGMMGPGMMGPGMMGPGMMGPGMMGGYAGLDLSDAQRDKIGEIQSELRQKHWALMGTMREAQYALLELESEGRLDDAEARKAYDAMANAHKQMFDSMLEARKRMNEVLTPQQRETLRENLRAGPRGPRGGR
ncbi:MAG: Spy/CpxP family protein refolding chaperone [Burkholderiales bacterium]|nr:Spy/CpxP family protein refolding chaperone [Burkholderiales bacterium]